MRKPRATYKITVSFICPLGNFKAGETCVMGVADAGRYATYLELVKDNKDSTNAKPASTDSGGSKS